MQVDERIEGIGLAERELSAGRQHPGNPVKNRLERRQVVEEKKADHCVEGAWRETGHIRGIARHSSNQVVVAAKVLPEPANQFIGEIQGGDTIAAREQQFREPAKAAAEFENACAAG